MRILLIEDEQEMAQLIKDRLKSRYVVDAAHTGKMGTHLAQVCQYDLIVLDLKLPDMSGQEVCQQLRNDRVGTPILILTGEGAVSDKVSTLDSGADDYLTKPFDFSELSARIRALLRRQLNQRQSILSAGTIRLNVAERTVTRDDQPITLRRKEFDLLEYLIRNKGKVLKREMILEHVWEDESEALTNVVDVHIKYLRDRIDRSFSPQMIKTVHGVGYKMEAE